MSGLIRRCAVKLVRERSALSDPLLSVRVEFCGYAINVIGCVCRPYVRNFEVKYLEN